MRLYLLNIAINLNITKAITPIAINTTKTPRVSPNDIFDHVLVLYPIVVVGIV